MIERVLKDEGTLQLTQRFRLMNKTWVAVKPWE
jgi:hypothetical protein